MKFEINSGAFGYYIKVIEIKEDNPEYYMYIWEDLTLHETCTNGWYNTENEAKQTIEKFMAKQYPEPLYKYIIIIECPPTANQYVSVLTTNIQNTLLYGVNIKFSLSIDDAKLFDSFDAAHPIAETLEIAGIDRKIQRVLVEEKTPKYRIKERLEIL